MESVRVRVEFEDRHILSKSQRSAGLKRSWLLLKPPQGTISDLASHLLHTFDLSHSCPNGIILSMDGFVLPPFESTCILKDKDVIRVKRKDGLLSEIVEVGDGANLIEEDEIVEKQPVLTDVPLLANEEFEKETGGYQSEPEEDKDDQLANNSPGRGVVSKKRKASEKLQSSKKKRKRHPDTQDTEIDFRTEQKESCVFHPGKSRDKKKKGSDVNCKSKAASSRRTAEINNDISETSPSQRRSDQLQENGTECVSLTQTPDGAKKGPSRSARRKKAKRQWLREIVKAEKKEPVASNMQLPQMQSPQKDMPKSSVDHKVQNENSEADNEVVAEEEIVPIVIRPGHIRFEPLGDDHTVQQNHDSMETFQWNGITSKKKGQKWGKEKLPHSRKNDYKDSNKERSEMMTVKKVKPPNDPIHFDKLAPFAGLPKEGDVIAYRLLELSSTWTPELSPFRVGKTSRYDPESDKVLLAPVPEYPITFEKPDEDACSEQPDNSLYGEDGSLEIDFSSLVDVRIVKHGNSDSAKAVTSAVNNGFVGNEVAMSPVGTSNNNNDKQALATTTSEKEGNTWDEISKALNAKKEELIRENGWNKESSGKGSWSFRALRSSALGPTMAILRARNDI